MAHTNQPYYDLTIHSSTDVWADHEAISLTGPTYEAVLAKAKAHNIDITDTAKWFITLWYRIDNETYEVLTWCHQYMVDGTLKWEGKIDLDSDPVPYMLAQKAEDEKVA